MRGGRVSGVTGGIKEEKTKICGGWNRLILGVEVMRNVTRRAAVKGGLSSGGIIRKEKTLGGSRVTTEKAVRI